jgi:Zn-dependent protease
LAFIGACMLAFDGETTFVGLTLLQINALLMVFNLLPFPGLDGFELLRPYLSVTARNFLEQWTPCLLLLIIFLPPIGHILSFLMNAIMAVCFQAATELHRLW